MNGIGGTSRPESAKYHKRAGKFFGSLRVPWWMFFLLLNDMRSAHFENQRIAARGSRRALEALLASEAVTLYEDGRFRKSYRAGGPLEWYNPPFSYSDPPIQSFEEVFPGVFEAGE